MKLAVRNIVDTYKSYNRGNKLEIKVVFRWPKGENCGRKASGYLLSMRKLAHDFGCTIDTTPVDDPKIYNPKDEVLRVYNLTVKYIGWTKE